VLIVLIEGICSIALVNVVLLVALFMAYTWHDKLKPMREHRRARQRAFERLLRESTLD